MRSFLETSASYANRMYKWPQRIFGVKSCKNKFCPKKRQQGGGKSIFVFWRSYSPNFERAIHSCNQNPSKAFLHIQKLRNTQFFSNGHYLGQPHFQKKSHSGLLSQKQVDLGYWTVIAPTCPVLRDQMWLMSFLIKSDVAYDFNTIQIQKFVYLEVGTILVFWRKFLNE